MSAEELFLQKYGNKITASESWVSIENDKFLITFSFDGKGEKLEDIDISQKIWEVVDHKTILKINSKDIK